MPYILIYAAFRLPKGAQYLLTAHSHPASWFTLHQAYTAMVQYHLTSAQRAIAQIP